MYNIIVASNRSGSYNVCETVTLIFASDEESEAEISDSALDFPPSDGETDVVMKMVK